MKKQQSRTARSTKKVKTGGRRMASSEPKQATDVFDLARLRDLIELMREYDLREVDLKQEKQHIRLSRGVDWQAPSFALPTAVPSPATLSSSSDASSESLSVPAAAAQSPNVVTINSPMVGTYYSKPNPDAAQFINVGDHVGPDTVVCIIEAMKVFNEIQAEVSGKVVAILVNNEESVDFGRALIKIDTSA